MSISAQSGYGPLFGPEESAEQRNLRDQLDVLGIKEELILDINGEFKPAWNEKLRPFCECCLKSYHYSDMCPYGKLVPKGAKIGPRFYLICRACVEDEFDTDEQQTCLHCGSIYKMAVEKECDVCGDRGHLEQDCQYRHLVDWAALGDPMIPPIADADVREAALKGKSLHDDAEGRTQGMSTEPMRH